MPEAASNRRHVAPLHLKLQLITEIGRHATIFDPEPSTTAEAKNSAWQAVYREMPAAEAGYYETQWTYLRNAFKRHYKGQNTNQEIVKAMKRLIARTRAEIRRREETKARAAEQRAQRQSGQSPGSSNEIPGTSRQHTQPSGSRSAAANNDAPGNSTQHTQPSGSQSAGANNEVPRTPPQPAPKARARNARQQTSALLRRPRARQPAGARNARRTSPQQPAPRARQPAGPSNGRPRTSPQQTRPRGSQTRSATANQATVELANDDVLCRKIFDLLLTVPDEDKARLRDRLVGVLLILKPEIKSRVGRLGNEQLFLERNIHSFDWSRLRLDEDICKAVWYFIMRERANVGQSNSK